MGPTNGFFCLGTNYHLLINITAFTAFGSRLRNHLNSLSLQQHSIRISFAPSIRYINLSLNDHLTQFRLISIVLHFESRKLRIYFHLSSLKSRKCFESILHHYECKDRTTANNIMIFDRCLSREKNNRNRYLMKFIPLYLHSLLLVRLQNTTIHLK